MSTAQANAQTPAARAGGNRESVAKAGASDGHVFIGPLTPLVTELTARKDGHYKKENPGG